MDQEQATCPRANRPSTYVSSFGPGSKGKMNQESKKIGYTSQSKTCQLDGTLKLLRSI